MDKLLDLKKGKISDAFIMYRFQCDCLSAEDAMDIDAEPAGGNDKFLTIRLDFRNHSLWERIKYALQILRGRWTWREFVPRSEDYGNLSDIFNPNKGYDELP